VVVPSIEERNLYRQLPEGPSGVQAAEPASDNDDMHLSTILNFGYGLARDQGTHIAQVIGMTMTTRVASWAGARLSRRVSRSLPWIGAGIAVLTVGATMRRKGVISGALDTGLNAMPLVGAAKNIIEVVRGRDFFPDRYGIRPIEKSGGNPLR